MEEYSLYLRSRLGIGYPENLRHHHNDYTHAPENIMVGTEDKLVLNLRKNKKKHICDSLQKLKVVRESSINNYKDSHGY